MSIFCLPYSVFCHLSYGHETRDRRHHETPLQLSQQPTNIYLYPSTSVPIISCGIWYGFRTCLKNHVPRSGCSLYFVLASLSLLNIEDRMTKWMRHRTVSYARVGTVEGRSLSGHCYDNKVQRSKNTPDLSGTALAGPVVTSQNSLKIAAADSSVTHFCTQDGKPVFAMHSISRCFRESR
jgi:hypothetical protein